MIGPLSRREWLAVAVCLPAAAKLVAQEGATFSTGVNVVNVLATVRNGKGEIIRDLTVNDFALEEGGHPQPSTIFPRKPTCR